MIMMNHTTLPLNSRPAHRIDWKKICMVEPIYLPTGKNGCRIHYDDGSWEDLGCRLSRLLEFWADAMMTTVPQMQKLSRAWLGSADRRRVPLVLNHQVCLIPVRCRQRQRHNDTASGYLVLHKIKQIALQPESGSYLLFYANPRPIPVLENRRYIQKNIAMGWALLDHYRQEQQTMLQL